MNPKPRDLGVAVLVADGEQMRLRRSDEVTLGGMEILHERFIVAVNIGVSTRRSECAGVAPLSPLSPTACKLCACAVRRYPSRAP